MKKIGQWLGRFLRQDSGQPLGEKEKKLLANLLVVGLVGLIVMLSFSIFSSGDPPKKTPEKSDEQTPAERNIERELERILSKVRGAGQVQVALTFEGGPRRQYATNDKEAVKDNHQEQNGGKSTSSETTVERQKVLVKRDGMREEALVERELAPKVQGVLIVAAGAADDTVAEKLSVAAATFLGVGQNRIVVMEGK